MHALNRLWLTIFPDIAYIFPDIAYFPDMAYVRHNGGVPTFARMRVFMCNEWKQNIKICGVLQVRHTKTHYDTRVPSTARHVRVCLVRVCFLLLHTLVSVVAYLCLCCGVLVFALWRTCCGVPLEGMPHQVGLYAITGSTSHQDKGVCVSVCV